MQGRMKEHPLSQEDIEALLHNALVGNLATLSPDGFPYVTPVHFVAIGGNIYIHGLCAGQKIDYLSHNSKVGFEVFQMNGILHDPNLPCDTNTDYQSIIMQGSAKIVESEGIKIKVLDAIVIKYTPQHAGKTYPAAMLKATAVIEITPSKITGKYFK